MQEKAVGLNIIGNHFRELETLLNNQMCLYQVFALSLYTRSCYSKHILLFWVGIFICFSSLTALRLLIAEQKWGKWIPFSCSCLGGRAFHFSPISLMLVKAFHLWPLIHWVLSFYSLSGESFIIKESGILSSSFSACAETFTWFLLFLL